MVTTSRPNRWPDRRSDQDYFPPERRIRPAADVIMLRANGTQSGAMSVKGSTRNSSEC